MLGHHGENRGSPTLSLRTILQVSWTPHVRFKGSLIYKVFNLHHFKQCEISHLTLATTIPPSSVSPLINHAPPSSGSFLTHIHTCMCTAVAVLDRTRRLRSNSSLNHRLWYHCWVTRGQPGDHSHWAHNNYTNELDTAFLSKTLRY
jgi:hypothetical protein